MFFIMVQYSQTTWLLDFHHLWRFQEYRCDLKTETDPVSETLYWLLSFFWNTEQRKNSKNYLVIDL